MVGGFTVIIRLAVLAHCPAVDVNVYVDVPGVDVLIVAGLQVPEIPFCDVAGKAGGVVF